MRCWLIALICCIGLFTAKNSCCADETRKALTLRVATPNNGRIRSHAALPLDVTVEWRSDELLEGYVEVTLREEAFRTEDRQDFGTYRTPDLVLSLGERTYQVLLPTVTLKLQGTLTYDLKFVCLDGREFDYGTSTMIVPSVTQRRLIIGLVLPDVKIPDSRTMFARFIRLEAFLEREKIHRDLKHHFDDVITNTVRVLSDDLPENANRLCAYDMLVLPEDALRNLNSRQLTAMNEWIEAGGKALIEVTTEPHRPEHVQFLNNLADSGGMLERPFSLDDDRKILMSRLPNDPFGEPGVAGFNDGLGRALVVPQPLSDWIGTQFVSSKQYRLPNKVCRFLWFARNTFMQKSRMAWRSDALNEPAVDHLNAALMPSSVKTVPVSSVVIMLVCFLLAISVGDYFLLGVLKRRLLTWVLFPALSLAFTWYTINMARASVGATDFTTAITIVDTRQDGQPLRTSRLEMLFTAAERKSETSVKNALFAPLGKHVSPHVHDQYDAAVQARFGAYQDLVRKVEKPKFMEFAADPPTCVGVVPGAFEVHRQMRKWTPQLGRFTRIGASAAQDLPEWKWNFPDSGPPIHSTFSKWAEQQAKQFPGSRFRIVGSRSAVWPEKEKNSYEYVPDRAEHVWQFLNSVHENHKGNAFCFTSRLSPTGGAWLEDLATLDSTAHDSWTLVAVVPQGDDFFVFRYTPPVTFQPRVP